MYDLQAAIIQLQSAAAGKALQVFQRGTPPVRPRERDDQTQYHAYGPDGLMAACQRSPTRHVSQWAK